MIVYNESTSNIVNKAWEELTSFDTYNSTHESKWVQEVWNFWTVDLDPKGSLYLWYIWKKMQRSWHLE